MKVTKAQIDAAYRRWVASLEARKRKAAVKRPLQRRKRITAALNGTAEPTPPAPPSITA